MARKWVSEQHQCGVCGKPARKLVGGRVSAYCSGACRGIDGKSDRAIAERFEAFVDRDGPIVSKELGHCWVWTGSRHNNGYPRFSVYGKPRYAHRVRWYLDHGYWPELFVCHKCDNGPGGCVRPDHLFLGTHRDNMRDMIAKRRYARPAAKLTPELVQALRKEREAGALIRELSKKYGVNPGNVSFACSRKQWRDVP